MVLFIQFLSLKKDIGEEGLMFEERYVT
uniref:Uncharacterized protein n=1 Tax=Rhizophora mucronata TaxID=61149 RepID=A0A2P2PKY7_RHIMU